jgi:hypothetical protein
MDVDWIDSDFPDDNCLDEPMDNDRMNSNLLDDCPVDPMDVDWVDSDLPG